ncbi:UDP-N-acetylglucosamine--LPS N-acetylglucosamine transferase [Micromonospora rosaria]|uniref:UDP-N-acetylglucosamine--LPS N-acetylglucosamine transferase n=1 Tax=Micromonospora rosaria TaxID=47874 RepID=A0A136PZW8_9ACTN|nr:glycosyltransferase [Micromonospora rosaria]KXK63953.1 UDP-N-acetylglucosamine--LPS N-acetylglucosamine transferase [Micromonospora rosaria]
MNRPGGGHAEAGHRDRDGDPESRSGDGRVVVVSADIGAGHDAAAVELAGRLAADGIVTEYLNFFAALPRPLHALVREGYRGLLSWLPWGYDTLFTITDRSPLTVTAIRAGLRLAAQRTLRRLPPDTRLVVTTFPFANQLLGPLRHRGQLTAPVMTYVTDFVVHPTWISPGIDVYCVIHEIAHRQATARGAQDVRVVGPLVSTRFAPTPTAHRRAARARFGLPEQDRLALIVAGAWGLGEVTRTAAEVLATGCVTPVVVCGRNDALRRRLHTFPGHVLGWVDDMPTLMRAVDVVVENAGGLTCQQSLASGLPTVTYRPIPGHGRANARVLAEAGLTTYVTTPTHLRPVLTALTATDNAPTLVAADDMAAVVAEAIHPEPTGPADHR